MAGVDQASAIYSQLNQSLPGQPYSVNAKFINTKHIYTGKVPLNPDVLWYDLKTAEIAYDLFYGYEKTRTLRFWTFAASIYGVNPPGFSVEDMPSYYLGILIGLGFYNLDQIKSICGTLSLEESRLMFRVDKRPDINTSFHPKLWSSSTGDCGCATFGVEYRHDGYASHKVLMPNGRTSEKCPCQSLDPNKKKRAEDLFNLLGSGL